MTHVDRLDIIWFAVVIVVPAALTIIAAKLIERRAK